MIDGTPADTSTLRIPVAPEPGCGHAEVGDGGEARGAEVVRRAAADAAARASCPQQPLFPLTNQVPVSVPRWARRAVTAVVQRAGFVSTWTIP